MKYISLTDFKKLKNTKFVNFNYSEKAKEHIRGISIDSRTIKKGEIFWAIQGDKFDGHNFVSDALQNGAVAIVVDSAHQAKFKSLSQPVIVVDDALQALQNFSTLHREKYRIPLIGITGTNGKTTTKEMIAWILQNKYKVLKTKGNFNNLIGVPLSLLDLNSEHEIAIIEMGTNQPGEIEKLVSIAKPNAALITNIGRGHLENFSSIDALVEEKLNLFSGINRKGNIFLNLDDPRLPSLKSRKKTRWSYSLQKSKKARVSGEFLELNDEGMGIWKLNGKEKIQLKVPGIHHVQNALAASTVAIRFGFNEKEIKNALQKYSAFDKRMQIIKSEGIVFINDCYNANPESFAPALKTLRHIATKNNGRKIVVMGDMLELGLESEHIHYDLILNMMEYDIHGIFTFGKYCGVVTREFQQKGYDHIFWFENHKNLAKSLKQFIKKGDYCLIKGSRGMQMEKVLGYL